MNSNGLAGNNAVAGLWSPAEGVESGGNVVGRGSKPHRTESREPTPPEEMAAANTSPSGLANWSLLQQSPATALLELVQRQVLAAAAAAAAASASVQQQTAAATCNADTRAAATGTRWAPSAFSSPVSSLSPGKPSAAAALSRPLCLPLQLPLPLLQLPLALPVGVPQWPLSSPSQPQPESTANVSAVSSPSASKQQQPELFARSPLTNPLLANAKVELLDRELWDRFHALTCEMVITRSGRYALVLPFDLDHHMDSSNVSLAGACFRNSKCACRVWCRRRGIRCLCLILKTSSRNLNKYIIKFAFRVL